MKRNTITNFVIAGILFFIIGFITYPGTKDHGSINDYFLKTTIEKNKYFQAGSSLEKVSFLIYLKETGLADPDTLDFERIRVISDSVLTLVIKRKKE